MNGSLPKSAPTQRITQRPSQAFTLVELLVVISIIVVMMAILVPAVTSIKGAGDVTKAAYDIEGVLDQAHAFAMGNNTYVWVGFYEEDVSRPSTTPATPGVGRVVVAMVASKDGSRYGDVVPVPAFGSNRPGNLVALSQVNKLLKLENMHLAGVNDGKASGASGNFPARPPVQPAYQVGDATGESPSPDNAAGAFAKTTQAPWGNTATFTYPIPPSATQTAANPQYTFSKIIEFNPQGEASKITENTYSGAGLQNWMEVALQPTHGGVVDPRYSGANQKRAAAAIQIEGLSGRTQLFFP